MNVNSPEERKIAKNCVAFCSALRRVEQQLRSEALRLCLRPRCFLEPFQPIIRQRM